MCQLWKRGALVTTSALFALIVGPGAASADITSITVDESRDFGIGDYTYAELTMHGTVARDDGSLGDYSVPAVLIYPNSGANGVGVVDWPNSVFYHFFNFPADDGNIFQFSRLTTDGLLFENGYTYMSVQWNKAVTEVFGESAPDDGEEHEHLAYGLIEEGPDAWEILRDAGRLLRDPSAVPGSGPAPVSTVISSGYSQTAALQMEFLAEDQAAGVYDGHILAAIGQICWPRDNVAPHYGFLEPCDNEPVPGDARVMVITTQTDMIDFGGFFSRRPDLDSWVQYELAGVSHLPTTIFPLGVDEQNPIDSRPVFRAAFENLSAWAGSGDAPPPARYVQGSVDESGEFIPEVDDDGNWLGGLRLPHMEQEVPTHCFWGPSTVTAGAPLGLYTGINTVDSENPFVRLGGTFTRFSDEELGDRYPFFSYVIRVARAANYLYHAGYILKADKRAYVEDAAGAITWETF